MTEAENVNAYEKTENTIIQEYYDSNVHILDGTKQKCMYYESLFEYEDNEPRFIVKDLFEFDYATKTSIKLDFLSEKEKYNSFFYMSEGKLISIDEDSNIFLLSNQYEIIASNNLCALTFPNNATEKCIISSFFDVKDDGQNIYINGLNDVGQATIIVLDYSLKEKGIFFSDKGWTLVKMTENEMRFVENGATQLLKYDEGKNKLTGDGKLQTDVFGDITIAGIFEGNEKYDFYYYTKGKMDKESGIKKDVLVGVKNGRQEVVFDFQTMGIDDLYVEQIQSDGLNGFWVWGTLIDQKMMLYHFTLCDVAKDYSAKAMKQYCKIGSLLPVDANIQYAIKRFNNLSEEYYLETMVYQEVYEDRDVAIMHMFLDCQDGKLDGIILDNIEDEFVKNDVLLDLNEYIEGSCVISRDKFIEHYIESITDEQGRIYAMYPSFRAVGYAYEEKIDFSNLLQYEKLNESTTPFFSFRGAEDSLVYLLSYSGDKFVDEKNGTVHVRDESFKTMLQFIKGQSSYKTENFDPVMQYCSGESLATRITLSEPCDYLYFNRLFHNNVVFSNVGTDNLVIGERKGMLGVCKLTNKKDAFFSFLDFLYEPHFYHEAYFTGLNMPVLKEEYELWKDYFLATADYEDKYGKFNLKYDFQIGVGASECVIEVGTISEQEATEAITVIQAASYIKPMKESYKQIILEEAMAFFEGNRSLNEVCDNMENRLLIALEENRE